MLYREKIFFFIEKSATTSCYSNTHLREIYAVYGLWAAATFGFTEFHTDVDESPYAAFPKRSHKNGPNYENDEESIFPGLRSHYQSQHQYSQLNARHEDDAHDLPYLQRSHFPQMFTLCWEVVAQ